MGSEPLIAAFERAKTVHALECVATLIGSYLNMYTNVDGEPEKWGMIKRPKSTEDYRYVK
jgi:hypothetical protein